MHRLTPDSKAGRKMIAATNKGIRDKDYKQLKMYNHGKSLETKRKEQEEWNKAKGFK